VTVHFGEALHYGRDRKKVSTVQNREASRFERFIYSKNCSGGPASVHNGEMSTLERCPHREVSLYIIDRTKEKEVFYRMDNII
jgi:hypothetical protein